MKLSGFQKLSYLKQRFIAKNDEMLQNQSGTNEEPLLVEIVQGKSGIGRSLITKIGANFFCNKKHTLNKDNSCTIRCNKYRKRDGDCHWIGKIQNITELQSDSENFWDLNNWIVKPHSKSRTHTCPGVSVNEIAALQMRELVKNQVDEGITDFETLKYLSGFHSTFDPEILGNDEIFNRIIQRRKKSKKFRESIGMT
jgi:hypothetical protein